MIRILGTILAGLLGLAFGSFLNVCLSRWPEGESVVKPRSYCRNCGRTLAWSENIPLVSWLALRGRCRTCKTKISWRYPMVELAVGGLWALRACQFLGSSPEMWVFDFHLYRHSPERLAVAILWQVFLWLLIALAVLDAENFWLPNWLTIPGSLLGLIYCVLRARLFYELTWDFGSPNPPLAIGVRECLTAILLSASIILLIRWTYWLIRRREGIGLGDAKLMAMLGAWLGLSGAVLSLAVGVLLGTLFSLIVLAVPAMRRESNTWHLSKLPLGTFLCVGGIVSSLWGPPIIAAYMHLVGLN